MKTKLFFLILFAAFCANAQIVNIPDAGFKSALLGTNPDIQVGAMNSLDQVITINSNGDSEIQVTEALAVHKLFLMYTDESITPIWSSITGVEAFQNLRQFNIGDVRVLLFELQNLPFLQKIEVNINQYEQTTANFSNLPLCTEINFQTYYVKSLNINNLPALKKLKATTLDYIVNFTCSVLPALEEFNFGWKFPQVPLDVTKFPNLKKFYVEHGFMPVLNFTGLHSLEEVRCETCDALTSVTFNDLPNVNKIYVYSEDLEEYNFGSLPKLIDLKIVSNWGEIPLIDLSGCSTLDKLDIQVSNLDFLNLKNGKSTYSFLNVNINNSNLDQNYICVDEGEEAIIQAENNVNTVISSYCSFTPGGNYNTITGTATFDVDNNGCGTGTDVFEGLMKVKISSGTTTGATFTNNLSQYKFFTQAGNFTITPEFENNWFTATPATATVNFANNNNNISTNNFCITSVGSHPDVEVVVYPISDAQPGFDAQYKIVYKNKGNQTLSGGMSFNYDETVLDFISSVPAEAFASSGQLQYEYSNLLPFEERSVIITMNLNGPTETPPLNLGDQLEIFAEIYPTSVEDEAPADNTFILQQEIIGAYDPNDIICLEGDTVSPAEIGDYLHYVVNFENTGTAPTSFIVARVDVNPAQYDITSLRVMNTSHASDIRVTGNKIEFIMSNTALAAGDHGNILFKIKTKSNLVQGNTVKKKASIYFDYNFPIVTNDANTIFQALSTGSWAKDDSVKLYPNPSAGLVKIEASSEIKSVELYDVQGRLLEVQKAGDLTATIDITTRTQGIYFVKVITVQGVKVEKFIKE